jgi:hypothetical protein
MSAYEKSVIKIIDGETDADINFADIRNFLMHLGFEESIRGSHHIFTRDNFEEILNLQPKGSKAKPYQIRQVSQLMHTRS